jgi:formylglycine-generating enzyme required for sulfatase activity
MMRSPDSDPESYSWEKPQHSVTVNGFSMGIHEVTQAEYRAVMGTNPSYFSGDNKPVERGSWYDAIDYCNAPSRREGLTPAYTKSGDNVTWNRSANGYRLSTGAEWEYACHAGTTTPITRGTPSPQARRTTTGAGVMRPRFGVCTTWLGTCGSGMRTILAVLRRILRVSHPAPTG